MINKKSKDNDRQKIERSFWDKFAYRYDSFMKRLEPTYDLLLKKIIKYIPGSSDVLEIATGTGIVAISIAPEVRRVYACDISPEMIKIAKEKKKSLNIDNIEFTVQDAYNLEYGKDSLDAVLAVNVLHIMMEPERAMNSVLKVLRPGGIFISATYCHGHNIKSRLISRMMSLAGFKAYSKWSIKGYRTFLKKNGFKLKIFEVIKDSIPLAFTISEKA